MVSKFLGSARSETGVRSTNLRKHEKFHSSLLADDRDLIVYLPPGYDESDRRYSVLYLHDGQNLFDGTTSYVPGMDWRVDETADALIRSGEIEPLIIVGIYNTGTHRVDEYTPTADPKLGGGHADLYGRMLVEEVKPMIDKEYRTLDGPFNTGLGGSSLGGLVSLYLGLQYPDVFGRVAVMSPSVWWANRAILGVVKAITPKPRLKIWLDIGTGEGDKALKDVRLLRRILSSQGWIEGEDLSYLEVKGANHSEAAWAERVGLVLQFLFPNRIDIPDLTGADLESLALTNETEEEKT
jgi:predicted alpha/beta superfamily hydrolase